MGHWEQIAEDNRRVLPVPLWRKIGAGILIGIGTVLAFAPLVVGLWKLWLLYTR